MKTINLLGILVLLCFILAISGCKEKEPVFVDEEQDQVAVVEPEIVDEPNLPEDGVASAGPDITQEPVEETLEPAVETETIVEVEAGDSDSDALTAENYRVVSLKDLKAYPEEMKIKVGTTVEWRNVNDKLLHIIGWSGQKQLGVKPEPIKQGESWSYTFNSPGKIVWFSTARPTVQGTIYVEE